MFLFRKCEAGRGHFCRCDERLLCFWLDAGNPINALPVVYGTNTIWQGLPALVVVLAGSITTTLSWCAVLNIRNCSYGEYLQVPAPSGSVKTADNVRKTSSLFVNYFFSGLAGTIWYWGLFFTPWANRRCASTSQGRRL